MQVKAKIDKKLGAYQHVSHGFAPVYDQNSKILILGSFPSVKSREEGFYYAHPRNRFWKILAAILQEKEPATIQEKKELLFSHGIAIYDVIEECDIIGSSDSNIKNVVPSDLAPILDIAQIQTIFTNGKTAERLYQKYQKTQTKLESVCLPSTSPANAAFSFERLMLIWREELKTKNSNYLL